MRRGNTSDDLPFWRKEDKTGHAFPSPLLTKFLIPFGSLLIAALALGPNYEKLPSGIILVTVLYLAVVAIVSLTYPAKQVFTWLMEKRIKRQMARRFYAVLEESVKTFKDLTADNRVHGFIYLLQQINSWDEFKGKGFSLTGIAFMRFWLESIENRLSYHRVDDFNNLAWDFSLLFAQYQAFCEQAHQHLESVVTWSANEPRLKDFRTRWNIAREKHVHLINNWEQIAKKVNELAGEHVCIDYYEPLKML